MCMEEQLFKIYENSAVSYIKVMVFFCQSERDFLVLDCLLYIQAVSMIW